MISFYTEDVNFKINKPLKTKQWLKGVVLSEGFEIGTINYIFCSDEYLLEINRQHLDHDYYTDIITFDNSDSDATIEGDLFISIDRVSENADNQSVEFDKELKRVLVHGLLHLTGHGDKTVDEIKEMRALEDHYLTQVLE